MEVGRFRALKEGIRTVVRVCGEPVRGLTVLLRSPNHFPRFWGGEGGAAFIFRHSLKLYICLSIKAEFQSLPQHAITEKQS